MTLLSALVLVSLTSAPAAESRASKLAQVRSFFSEIDGVQLGFECSRCSVEERARARDPLLVLQGVREVLGEGPDDTPELTLEVRSRRVVVVGALRSDDDRRRLALAESRFPELLVHVER